MLSMYSNPCVNGKTSFRFYLFLALLFLAFTSYADQPPEIGNFALRTSQQPGPLIGFGFNVIDAHEKQIYLTADDYVGVGRHQIDFVPIFIYGITDELSIAIAAPYALSYKSGNDHSSGPEDAYLQLETAVYSTSNSRYTDQATIVLNASAPTGSPHKNPNTGIGSPSFFLGTTFDRTYVDWLLFGGLGAQLTTAHDGTKYGNNYLYQFGFGRNITDTNGWILAWIMEIDGTYSQHNRVDGIFVADSGGNIIYVTPSFWASTNSFIFQFGVGAPATQHWNGNQTSSKYLAMINFGWSF